MAYDMSGVDVFFLAKELKSLEGAKVDKITQIDKKLFTIRFFAQKQKTTLRILVPEILNITGQKYESPLTPLGFCSFLRKYLQNTRLVSVSQKSFERIIILEFQSLKFGNLFLITELFKPGNMILCKLEESKLIILNALEKQEFKARKVGAREEYIFPPEQNSPLQINEELKEKLSAESQVPLGKRLATMLSLGGIYAEEIIARSGLDKNAKSLSSDEMKALIKALNEFFGEPISCGEAKGRIFPVAMRTAKFERTYSSFNEGLDSVKIEAVIETKSAESKKRKSKTESLLSIQEKRIRELEREIDENQKCGEFIYEHYQEFAKLLDYVRDLRSKNVSFDKIEEMLKENRHFRKIDKSKKTIAMSWNDKAQSKDKQ